MKILLNNFDLNEALKKDHNIGFVPTMGSIHEGHVSLVKRSKKESKKTLVSIFINPKQFNNKKDYKNYPKNIKKDLRILKKLKVDFIYIPQIIDVFNKEKKQRYRLNKKDKILCAKYRPGHFEGVLEVMDRLTHLIKPKKIFMGEKDYQQLFLLKRYIEKKYKSKIIGCKTIRDKNNLALSSRNLLLNKKQLILASKVIQRSIKFKKSLDSTKNIQKLLNFESKKMKKIFKIKIEYFELRNKKNLLLSKKVNNSRIFIAYYINKIRLIDNF